MYAYMYYIHIYLKKMNHSGQNKVVGQYTFGQTIANYGDNMTIHHAINTAKNIQVTIYTIPQSFALNHQQQINTFLGQINKNQQKIYPKLYDIIKTKNNIYIIFQDIVRPHLQNQSQGAIKKLLEGLQNILFNSVFKLQKQNIYMINDPSLQLCLLPTAGTSTQGGSNLYSQFHNKSVLVELFIDIVKPINQIQCKQVMLQNIKASNLFQLIKIYVIPTNTNQSSIFKSKGQLTKQSMAKILQQSSFQYPSIDEDQFQQLTKFANVNNALKQEANRAYLSASIRANQQLQNSDLMINAIQQIKQSVVNQQQMQQKSFHESKPTKSKLKMSKINQHSEDTTFDSYYNLYAKIFDLFDKTIKSYLERYPKGFSGIIASYLISLISIYRMAHLYQDMIQKKDIFNLDFITANIDYTKYIKNISQHIGKQRKRYMRLKQIIQSMSVPYKVMEILMPYLEDDISLIDLKQVTNYCFHFMAKLIQMKNKQGYHEILVLQTMEVLKSDNYSIVYDQEDMPLKWDKKYYQFLKLQLTTLHPTLKL